MSNAETVRAIYQAFAERDLTSIRSLMHPEIEWNQMEGFPNGGRHIGAEKVLTDLFGQFRNDWTDWTAKVDRYVESGDTVVALGSYSGTYKHTGKSMRAGFAHLYTIDAGKIVRFVQYTDTLKIAEARV